MGLHFEKYRDSEHREAQLRACICVSLSTTHVLHASGSLMQDCNVEVWSILLVTSENILFASRTSQLPRSQQLFLCQPFANGAYPAGAGWGLGLNPGCNPRGQVQGRGSNNLNLRLWVGVNPNLNLRLGLGFNLNPNPRFQVRVNHNLNLG